MAPAGNHNEICKNILKKAKNLYTKIYFYTFSFFALSWAAHECAKKSAKVVQTWAAHDCTKKLRFEEGTAVFCCYAPKLSKRMFSGATPRESRRSTTHLVIIGGPHMKYLMSSGAS